MWMSAVGAPTPVAEKTIKGLGGIGAGWREAPGRGGRVEKRPFLGWVGPPSTSHPEQNKRLRKSKLPS